MTIPCVFCLFAVMAQLGGVGTNTAVTTGPGTGTGTGAGAGTGTGTGTETVIGRHPPPGTDLGAGTDPGVGTELGGGTDVGNGAGGNGGMGGNGGIGGGGGIGGVGGAPTFAPGVTYNSNGQGGFGAIGTDQPGFNTPALDDDSEEGSGSGENGGAAGDAGGAWFGGGPGLLKSSGQRWTVTVLSCLLAVAVIALIAFFIIKRKRGPAGASQIP